MEKQAQTSNVKESNNKTKESPQRINGIEQILISEEYLFIN
jgi:hypothetical protein